MVTTIVTTEPAWFPPAVPGWTTRRHRFGPTGQHGFTLVDMMMTVALIGVLMAVAVPALLRARNAAQASSALGTLRAIYSAQVSYSATCAQGYYSPDFMTLGVIASPNGQPFLAPDLTAAATFVKNGYRFSMTGRPDPAAPATCNGLGQGGAAHGYAVVADPIGAAASGRFFGGNGDAVLYEHTVSFAAVMPETGVPPSGNPIR